MTAFYRVDGEGDCYWLNVKVVSSIPPGYGKYKLSEGETSY